MHMQTSYIHHGLPCALKIDVCYKIILCLIIYLYPYRLHDII